MRLRRQPTPSLLGRVSAVSDRDARRARGQLARALKDLERCGSRGGGQLLEVQLLAQVVAPKGYTAFKSGRERAWANTPHNTSPWPKRLEDAEHAALLLPLAAGRVGAAVGLHPAVIATPIFGCGAPAPGRSIDDLVLGMVLNWVANPPDDLRVQLAPPVIETIAGRSVGERRVQDFGLRWPLPTSDGV